MYEFFLVIFTYQELKRPFLFKINQNEGWFMDFNTATAFRRDGGRGTLQIKMILQSF